MAKRIAKSLPGMYAHAHMTDRDEQQVRDFETDMTLMVYAYTVIKDRTVGDVIKIDDLRELKKIKRVIKGRIIESQPTDGPKLNALSEEELDCFIEDWAEMWIQRERDPQSPPPDWATLDDDLT